jgi:hypothetical protein
MEFDLADEVKKLVETNKIDTAIEIAENELKKIPVTDFHKVLGRNFLNLSDDLTEFITYFYTQAAKEIEVKAMYSEMNGFTINYDLWFLDLFAFKTCGGLDDTDWLADYEFSIEESMVLSGLEDIQAVYEDYMKNEKWSDGNLENAMEVCEIIIVLRLQELFKKSIDSAIEKKIEWSKIPIFATAHDYEILYSSKL